MQIRLRRQGVSRSLNARFAPCPHGEPWFVSLQEHSIGGWLVELSYPGCSECFGRKSGQICASNLSSYRRVADVDEAKDEALALIREHVNARAQWTPETEAYMYYKDSDYSAYPHLVGDSFIAACLYDVAVESIVDVSGGNLVSFDGKSCVYFKDHPWAEQISRACSEFRAEHVQRAGELHSRGWLAWLLSEYIKDNYENVPTFLVSRMVVNRREE